MLVSVPINMQTAIYHIMLHIKFATYSVTQITQKASDFSSISNFMYLFMDAYHVFIKSVPIDPIKLNNIVLSQEKK